MGGKMIINNAFSTKMLTEGKTLCEFNIIDETEFRQALSNKDAHIVIGHPDTAEYFGCKMNRKTVYLQKGDILYTCELNNETGERLPSGTEFISQLGNGFYFRFFKIRVI